jgi:hypothetical protein
MGICSDFNTGQIIGQATGIQALPLDTIKPET